MNSGTVSFINAEIESILASAKPPVTQYRMYVLRRYIRSIETNNSGQYYPLQEIIILEIKKNVRLYLFKKKFGPFTGSMTTIDLYTGPVKVRTVNV